MWPCFYGIDFASRAELIASGLGVEEIRASIGADSLAFVSLSGLTAASAQPAERLCRACFDGQYPIPVPQRDLIGKHVLEGLARGAVRNARLDAALDTDTNADRVSTGQVVVHNGVGPADPMDAMLEGAGAADALTRP
jgi:amidophosphoribosyltransferase